MKQSQQSITKESPSSKRYLSFQAHLTASVQVHFARWAAGVAARVPRCIARCSCGFQHWSTFHGVGRSCSAKPGGTLYANTHQQWFCFNQTTADLAACYICTLRLCVICYCIVQVPFGCAMLCGQPHQHDHLLLLTTILKSSWHSKHSKHCLTNCLHVTSYIALCEAAKWLWG